MHATGKASGVSWRDMYAYLSVFGSAFLSLIFQDSFGFHVFRRGVANALLGQGSATETIRHGLGHAPGSYQFEVAYRTRYRSTLVPPFLGRRREDSMVPS